MSKFRCTRCRKTRPIEDKRSIEKTWRVGRGGAGTMTRAVAVCAPCAEPRARPPLCSKCGSIPDRVQGRSCTRCGLLRAVDKPKPTEQLKSSPIAAFDFVA